MGDIEKVIELLRKKMDEAKLTYLDSLDLYANGLEVSRVTRKYNQGAYDAFENAWRSVVMLKKELEAGNE